MRALLFHRGLCLFFRGICAGLLLLRAHQGCPCFGLGVLPVACGSFGCLLRLRDFTRQTFLLLLRLPYCPICSLQLGLLAHQLVFLLTHQALGAGIAVLQGGSQLLFY